MERRRFSPREKLEIVLEGLRDGGQIPEVCPFEGQGDFGDAARRLP